MGGASQQYGRAAAASAQLLREYAREAGRSVLARVETPADVWEGGVNADEPRPAASLLKVPLALAAEDAFASGTLDPQARVTAGRLTAGVAMSALHVLDAQVSLTAKDVLGLSLALSDGPCAAWLLEAVGVAAVRAAAAATGCEATSISAAHDSSAGPLVGCTTARDALRLLAAATDDARHPVTANALRHTVLNSRIPLGADDADARIAHKTGTLPGVANDVAVLDCREGRLLIAFLTEAQHDTLVSGYEMGLCTRGLLRAWGLGVARSRSVA